MNEPRSFPSVQSAKPGAKQVRGKGRTELDELVNDDQQQEPEGGEADRPEKNREDGLTSTPRQ